MPISVPKRDVREATPYAQFVNTPVKPNSHTIQKKQEAEPLPLRTIVMTQQ